ncbi:Clavaminate synthase-like protein, partial [Aureobasidium melanogenum]
RQEVSRADSATGHDEHGAQTKGDNVGKFEVDIDGEQLLQDAEDLFRVGKSIFDLPVEEKVRYDLKDQGSYFGYKGYGEGVIDAKGTKDRNEFYNVSKDDILGLSEPLPAPKLLGPRRDLLRSFMQHSHAIVDLLLSLLNRQLGLPHDKLSSLHRLGSVSGDQVRWVHAPPQPMDDRRTALGQHTDFGSVTILFNRLGGLQVLPPDSDEWCYVRPLRSHAVVNLGDAMVKFSAGILRSNVHRVVNPPGQQADHTRMSLVYFARPADDVILKALNGSTLIDEKRRQNPDEAEEQGITSKEWILRRALGRRQGGDWTKSGGTESGRV